MDTQSRVTVLLCTANRPALLEQALSSLARGVERPDEVVVVNGGDGETERIVERNASAFAAVTIINYENRNLAVSRNIGLSHCTGDIVAMTDDDAVVAEDWVRQIRAAFSSNPVVGVVGGPVLGTETNFLSRLADCVVFPYFPERQMVRTVPGVNAAYRQEVVAGVGEYDDSLFRGEDVDYNWRARRLGYQIMYDPTIRVAHQHRSSFIALLEQQYMYGRAYVLVRRKWPDMYCVYPHQIRTIRDVMKAVHCVLAVIYQPVIAARRLPRRPDRVVAYPLLLVHHATWKIGMLRQLVLERGRRDPLQTAARRRYPTVVHRWVHGVAQAVDVDNAYSGALSQEGS